MIILLCYDLRELLHTEKRRGDTCKHLLTVFKEYCISCELELAGPEYDNLQAFSSLPLPIAEELLSHKQSDEKLCNEETSKASVTVDNHMSPAHTLLQIKCIDQKGLFYDILRTSKDCNVQVLDLMFFFLDLHLI